MEQQFEIYSKLLSKFLSVDPYREWMQIPFNAGDRTIATDATCLLSVPLQKCYEDKSDKVKGVYPISYNMRELISVKELREKLKQFPVIDCFDEVESKCDACNGDGEVEFEFYYCGTNYEIEEDCPVCKGSGVYLCESKTPNGKKEFDFNKFFKIGDSFFNVLWIEKLLFVAESLSEDNIFLVAQMESDRPSLFLIKDVELLIMPLYCSDESKIGQSIEI